MKKTSDILYPSKKRMWSYWTHERKFYIIVIEVSRINENEEKELDGTLNSAKSSWAPLSTLWHLQYDKVSYN